MNSLFTSSGFNIWNWFHILKLNSTPKTSSGPGLTVASSLAQIWAILPSKWFANLSHQTIECIALHHPSYLSKQLCWVVHWGLTEGQVQVLTNPLYFSLLGILLSHVAFFSILLTERGLVIFKDAPGPTKVAWCIREWQQWNYLAISVHNSLSFQHSRDLQFTGRWYND